MYHRQWFSTLWPQCNQLYRKSAIRSTSPGWHYQAALPEPCLRWQAGRLNARQTLSSDGVDDVANVVWGPEMLMYPFLLSQRLRNKSGTCALGMLQICMEITCSKYSKTRSKCRIDWPFRELKGGTPDLGKQACMKEWVLVCCPACRTPRSLSK